MTSADMRRNGPGSEPKGLAIVTYGSLEILQRQPNPSASRVTGGVVAVQFDRLVEINQSLGVGAGIGPGICTIAVRNSLLIGRVGWFGNDLRAGSDAHLSVTNLIAVGYAFCLYSTNAAQDYNATKDKGSHAKRFRQIATALSSNEGVQGFAIPEGRNF
jgi:hypothetical protein